jgi:hypothetical protein
MEFTNDWETAFLLLLRQSSLAYKDKVWNGRRDCDFIMIPIHVAMQ